MYKEDVQISDKIIAAATNVTGGTIGIIWLIFCALTKKRMSKFLLFNIYQSAFLALFLYIAGIILAFAYNILVLIPLINKLANFIYLLLFTPIYYHLSIIGMAIFTIYVYLFVCSIIGIIGRLPFISNIILYQLERF